MKSITIDLSKPLGGIRVKKEQLLQLNANDKIDKLLRVMQNVAKGDKVEGDINISSIMRCNNTIFIHGERGAGKTTYLHALLDRYQNKQETSELNIIPLPLIDPTLVSTQQHILVDIIAKFAKLVRNKLNHCCDAEKFELFRSKLDALAEGVQLLSNQESSSKYDASWFLSKAINKSSSGIELERGIHSLIDTMANILNTELFLIAIDDVDTDTKKAHEVLEVIRRYLTHPRLVVALTGDLKLYSHIVRKAKYEELKAPGCDNSNTQQLVEHLEQQYLAKVLPIEQRVNLNRLTEIANSYTVSVTYNSSTIYLEETEIREFIKNILCEALNTPAKHLKPHVEFILSLPVRTVFQLLKTMIESDVDPESKKPKYTPLSLKTVIYHSFVGSLVKQGLELESLNQPITECHTIGYEMFKLLNEHGELETGFYVRPDSGYAQGDYNTAKIYLSACIASLFTTENLGVANGIKTILTCGATSNIYMNFVTDKLAQSASYQNYIDYIGLNRFDNITSFVAHFSPLVIPDEQGKKAIASGVVRTLRGKPRDFNEDNFKAITSSDKRLVKLEKLISGHYQFDLPDYVAAKTVLLASHRAQTTTEGRDYISAYRLLAGIAELLTQSSPDIEKLCSTPTYAYPNFFAKGTKGGDYKIDEIDEIDETEKDEQSGNDNKDNAELLNSALSTWINDFKKQEKFSSLLLGKIWTRLHYSLNQVSDVARNKVKYDGISGDIVLGTLVARFVWAIINAVLIEECRYGYHENQKAINAISTAKNVETSHRELMKNISDLLAAGDFKLPFTETLLACPLLWPFLGNKDLSSIVKKILPSSYIDAYDKFSTIEKPEKLKVSALPIVGVTFKE